MHKFLVTTILIFGLSHHVMAEPGPGFSLHNKAKTAIYVNVINDPSLLERAKNLVVEEGNRVWPGGFFDKTIKLNKETSLVIFNSKNETLYRGKFSPNKTIYVNWDDAHAPKLYPQRGPLWGVTKKTDKGYDLTNNVTQEDIKQTE